MRTSIKKLTLITLLVGLCLSIDAQNVTIPDNNFRNALLLIPGIDINQDGIIQISEAANFTGTINVNNNGISDLTGIEAFTALTVLNCSNNNLTSINISANTALTSFNCDNNLLTNLDVSTNTLLSTLVCRDNLLTSLDVSSNTQLYEFRCSRNQITALDVSNHPNLFLFACAGNQLTSIDVSTNTNLEGFFCNDNLLTSLNVSANPLVQFWCYGNQLTSLNLTSNPNLATLQCSNNLLTSLDLSANLALFELGCTNNPIVSLNLSQNSALTTIDCSNMSSLTSLNIQNGNNLNLTNFNATSNQLLTCIQVDNFSNMNTAWGGAIDVIAGYSTDCSCIVYIPDNNFRAALKEDETINTNNDGIISCAEAAAYAGAINVTSLGINDLTGIEAFSSLTTLTCNQNSLTSINLTSNTAIVNINVADNQLTNLNVSNLGSLAQLACGGNQLTSINLSTNNALAGLDCGYNLLSNLNLTANNLLTFLWCENNQLIALNMQNGNNSNLSSFIATGNPNLTCIQVDDPPFMSTNWVSSIDVGANFSLFCTPCTVNIPDANFKAALIAISDLNTNQNSEIECYETIAYSGTIDVSNQGITDMTGIEAFVNITTLDCSGNPAMSSLNVTNNTFLTHLFCQGNNITTLNTANNMALIELNCNNNNMTLPNVGLNTNLQILNCAQNSIYSLNLSELSSLTELICNSSGIDILNIQNGNNNNLTVFNATNNNLTCVQVDDASYMNTNWPSAIDAVASFNFDCSAVWCSVNIPDANFKAALVANTAINTNGNGEIECTEAAAYTGTINVNNQNITDLTGIEYFTNLLALNCHLNNITNLDLSYNTQLLTLDCGENTNLLSLDVSNNTLLQSLTCNFNGLTSLDLSNNTALTTLICPWNSLTSLDVTNNTLLSFLQFEANQISTIDISSLNNLINLYADQNTLTSIIQSPSSLPSVQLFRFSGNYMTSFDFSKYPNITDGRASYNQLTTLDLSTNANLIDAFFDHNQLTTVLYPATSPNLQRFAVNNNLITSLDISNGANNLFTELNLLNNPNLTCIQVDNVNFMNNNWGTSKDAIAIYSSDCNCNTSVSGNVIATAGIVNDGYAILYNLYNSNTQADSINRKTLDVNGAYDFNYVNQGNYIVKVFPNTTTYPNLLNTYYQSEFLWDSATVVAHTCATNSNLPAITMMELTGTGGGIGQISGYILEGPGYTRNIGDPLPGVDIKIGRNPGGGIAANITTDANGQYQFTNLSNGSYTIYVDIPGRGRDSSYTVTIDPNNTTYTYLNYVVDSNSVYIDNSVGIITFNKPAIENLFAVYPNPFNETALIEYYLDKEADVQLSIYNVLGEKLHTLVNTKQPKGKQQLNLSKEKLQLKAGIYFVSLSIDNVLNTKKIVVQ